MRECLALSLVLLGGSACAPSPQPTVAATARPATPTPATPTPAGSSGERSEARAHETVVLVLGDSLAAGYGLPAAQAFPALIEASLSAEGLPLRVVNAGVSGDTTAGGLRRIDWVLKANEPDVVILELGGNDGLRGLSLADTEQNLRGIIEKCRLAGARVLLTGMLIPPNYGPDYSRGFAEIFPRVAESSGSSLLPFLLEGVAGDSELNLPDGLHPNAAGHLIIAESVSEALRPLIARE